MTVRVSQVTWLWQVQELQDALRGKNNTTIKMKQTLVDKEKEQDTLLQQLDEKTEKIHEINQQFIKQDNELHVLTMEIKAFEDKFSEQKQLAGQKVGAGSLDFCLLFFVHFL